MLKSFYSKLKEFSISNSLKALFLNENSIIGNNVLFSELEKLLVEADVSIHLVPHIIRQIKKGNNTFESVKEDLKGSIMEILNVVKHDTPLSQALFDNIKPPEKHHSVIICGVNGSGKSTTIAKISNLLKLNQHSIIVAAADTFRAAATEQLERMLLKTGIVHEDIFISSSNCDPASVCYKGFEATIDRNYDIFIADTAGRLPTNIDLARQLEKIAKTINKLKDTAPSEVILVVDGTSGQNVLSQVAAFNDIVKISGLIITKLDNRAKGGTIISIINKHKIPVVGICNGEDINAIQKFDAKEFVDNMI
ncbi:P-loop NTPase fold protein [Candidatus Fokinia crypta]|uniref:Signal recognition particle receptor FtsY n=1 Tax=Candidatus Fokinia crypta TaxID=1920990 RepID=A0ABZ0UST4_9RICK|nr:P-loop NTPase fold protein [Candidatus Fokinia cryptica]WPX97980.1 Signal recognition particle receptor FtsY [Candidatus Fokinia cryptica]